MTRSSWGLDTDRDLDWRLFAACGPKNAEWFFVTGGKLSALNRTALELCAGCPVRSECFADATAFRVDGLRIAGGQVIQDRVRVKTPAAAGVLSSGRLTRHERRRTS